jgi:drug/metabolite transporter (DMT)-like permease
MMTIEVIAAVLCAALLHAIWNSLVKGGEDKFISSALTCLWCGAIALVVAIALPAPAGAAMPYVAASGIIHVAYFLLVARLYRNSDLSVSYPIMRGLAPLMSAAGALFWLGETPTPATAAAVLLLVAGVLWMAREGLADNGVDRGALVAALANSAIIALYTLIDGKGARLSGSAFAYNAWADTTTAMFYLPLTFYLRGAAFLGALQRDWARSSIGGAAAFAAYATVIWAMTKAPIAPVAALRESSVVFAAFIGVYFLGERGGKSRYLAIVLILAGVLTLHLE